MSSLFTHRSDWLKAHLQYLIPQHLLTQLTYRLSHCQIPWLKHLLITQYIRIFKVNMAIAKHPDPKHYASLNQFFTRQLSTTARPIIIDHTNILSPIDGTITQMGTIQDGNIIQAKKKWYSLEKLIIKSDLADTFHGGTFLTLYLSPKDYHRIHMPLSAQLRRMIYVPGRLFSVGSATVRFIDNIYTNNERLINIFHNERTTIAIIMVGALNVGSMATTWAGEITPATTTRETHYTDTQHALQQGQEMGRFNLGSTVIILFPKNTTQWSPQLCTEKQLIVGECIGQLT